ncbi:MAG: divalent-cation tolerance protein CutA [Bryobacteraceae bacterium]
MVAPVTGFESIFFMTDKIVILCTCTGAEEAGRLAGSLVEARLAACVSVIPHVRSYYRWKGAMESSDEYLLAIKSSRRLFDALRAHIAKVHSYEVPEILALPVVAGSDDYLIWLDANLDSPAEKA